MRKRRSLHYCSSVFLLSVIVLSFLFMGNNIPSIEAPEGGHSESWVLAVDNNYLFSHAKAGVDIFSINSNGSLSYVNSIIPSIIYSDALYVGNGILVIRTEYWESQIYNVSDPSNISLLGTIDWGCYSFQIHNDLLITGSHYGFRIYNISNLEQPMYLSYIEKGALLYQVFAEDDILYIRSDGNYPDGDIYVPFFGILIFDISNPAAPELIALDDSFKKSVYDFYVRDRNIFLAAEEGIFHGTFNETHITFQKLQPGAARYQITVIDDFLFVGSNPIFVFDIEDPSSPYLLASFPGNSHMWDLTNNREYLYYALGNDGIGMLRIEESYTSKPSIGFGYEFPFVCAGFVYGILSILLITTKSRKKS